MVMTPDSEFFNYLKSDQGLRAGDEVARARPVPPDAAGDAEVDGTAPEQPAGQ
jgi:hypothetical protein